MERRMSSMTQMEIAKVIEARKPVILPTGATEAHGPHMPTDTDTHQVEHIALELSARIDAVVAPPVAYGISKTFEFFPGTISCQRRSKNASAGRSENTSVMPVRRPRKLGSFVRASGLDRIIYRRIRARTV